MLSLAGRILGKCALRWPPLARFVPAVMVERELAATAGLIVVLLGRLVALH